MVVRVEIIEALKRVEDPELFLDIWFLGLVYNIDIDEGKVGIEMTFTTPLCPAGPQLVNDVKMKVGEVPGVSEVEVRVVFQPPWTPPEEVKATLGMI
jgi:metal-sulfur cluster biosynthetic enzyme